MKTAMQDMLEWIEQRFNNPQETEVFKKATELLEKEKEHIIEAYCNGYYEGVNDSDYTADKYYDKIYSQDSQTYDGVRLKRFIKDESQDFINQNK